MDHVNDLPHGTFDESLMGNLDPGILGNDNIDWGGSNDYRLPQNQYLHQQQQQPQIFSNSPSPVPGSYGLYATPQASQLNSALYQNHTNQQYQQNAVPQQRASPYGGNPYLAPQAAPQYQQQPSTSGPPQQSFLQQSNYYSQPQQSFNNSQSTYQMAHPSQVHASTHSPSQFQSPSLPATFNAQQWTPSSSQNLGQTAYQTSPQDASYIQQKPSPQPSLKPTQSTPPVPVALQRAVQPAIAAPQPAGSFLRITNKPLVDSLRPGNMFDFAPFLGIGDQPVDHVITGKTDFPKFKPRKNRSGKPLVPGLDIKPSTDGPKVRKSREAKSAARELKAARKESKATTGKDVKSRVNALGVVYQPTASPSAASTPTSDESSSSEDSSDSDYESEMPIERLEDVRQPARPTSAAGAAAWDVTGILWLDRKRNASKDEIVKAIPQFQEYITGLRDDAKNAVADVSAAEEAKKPAADIKRLIQIRTEKRNVLAKALEAAMGTGHPHILENLGNSQRLVMILANVLSESYKVEDFNGELPKAVLSLMSKFAGLTDTLLQKLKFETTAKRFAKKGDSEVKEYFSKILSSTPEGKERAKKAQEEAVKLEKIKNGLAMQERARARDEAAKLSASTGSKRAHDGEGINGKPNKKVASDSTAVNSTKAAALKPATPAARTTGLFASLKKPSSKLASAAGAASSAKKPEVKPITTSAPVATKQSSFLDLLDSIEKPKEVIKVPEAPTRPVETPEEQAKRERKESRRHLRVRWKDGSALEEIRLFRHEQAEDEGRQDDMLRDAHDDRSEGLRLKQAREVVDAEGEEEEDEPLLSGETCIKARYFEPLPIDFSTLNEKSRKENFVTRGGAIEFRTPAQEAQERREMMEMMVFYVDPNTIPSSPKEPPVHAFKEVAQARSFGAPRETWINQRLEEIYKYGPEQAIHLMHERENERRAREGPPPQFQLNKQQSQQHINLHGQLSEPVSTVVPESAMDPQQLAELQRIVDSLKGKPYPATEPPAWMSTEMKLGWYKGYNRDNAKKRDLEQQMNASVLAQDSVVPPPQVHVPQLQAPQIQNPFPPPMPAPGFYPPPPHAYANQNPAFDVAALQSQNQNQDWAAWMAAQMGGQFGQLPQPPPAQQYQQQAPPRPQPQGLNYDDEEAAYPAGYDQQGIHPSRRGLYNDEGDQRSKKKRKAKQGGSNGGGSLNGLDEDDVGGDGTLDRYGRTIRNAAIPATMPPSEQERTYKGKKKPCKFWSEGKCAKGTACGFLHE